MKVNITAGSILNNLLKKKYSNELFIPFNEAMINGTYSSKLFSNEFILERAKTHNVSVLEYKENLKDFLNFLKNIHMYNEVILWFGEEPFCKKNTEVVLQTLKEYNFDGKIVLNIVIEEIGEIIKTINLK